MQPNIYILVELQKRDKMYCLLVSEYVVYLCRWACGQKFFCLRLHANEVNRQYNAKWPMSLFYVVKSLLTIIANGNTWKFSVYLNCYDLYVDLCN